jgi:hypothetical protein
MGAVAAILVVVIRRYVATGKQKINKSVGVVTDNQSLSTRGGAMYSRDGWRQYGRNLDSYERTLKDLVYRGIFDPPVRSDWRKEWEYRDLPEGSLTPKHAAELLSSEALAPPHGLDLLHSIRVPDFPACPARPEAPAGDLHQYTLENEARVKQRADALREDFKNKHSSDTAVADALREAIHCRDLNGARRLIELTHTRHPLPKALLTPLEVEFDETARVVLCTIEIPNFASIPIVKKRGDSYRAKWLPVSVTEKRRVHETILYSLCLRAAYLAAHCDVDIVAVNALQKWFDSATGALREGIIPT